jgi:hypothetical protein
MVQTRVVGVEEKIGGARREFECDAERRDVDSPAERGNESRAKKGREAELRTRRTQAELGYE